MVLTYLSASLCWPDNIYQCKSYKSGIRVKCPKIEGVIFSYHYTSGNSTDFFKFSPEFHNTCKIYVCVHEGSRLEKGPGTKLGGRDVGGW